MLLPCFVFLVSYILIVETANILVVVPTPSISHQVVFRPLVQRLVERGHEVTLITTDPIYPEGNGPQGLTEIDLHELSYTLWEKMLNTIIDDKLSDMLSSMTVIFRVLSEVFMKQIKDEAVQNLIKNRSVKFDLLVLEACVTPALIFTHIFKVPVIQMSSFGAIPGNMHTMGSVTHPILYPTQYHEKLYNLTIRDKIVELLNHVSFDWMLDKRENEDHKMLQYILSIHNMPSLNELKKNVDLLFLNVHPIWVDNQPVPPNVISIWGIHKTTEKSLPKDLQSFLDNSLNGVIYFSWGTNLKTSLIPLEKLQIFVKVLSRLPYDVLWKWDTDELPGRSHNIKISKWFPQSDLLRHPKIKLFITQGGLQSTEEAINGGVPLIGIPMFADQPYNSEKYVRFKIGKRLDFNSLTEENFENAIISVITDESYRQNIIKLRQLMTDQPQTPLERAIWWTEYVLRHKGAKHLRAPAANMPWTEYYELDLVLVIVAALFVTIFAAVYMLRFLIFFLLDYFKHLNKKKVL